jgi:hypothetical protein
MSILVAQVQTALSSRLDVRSVSQPHIERAIELSDRFKDIKPDSYVLPLSGLSLCNANHEQQAEQLR